MENVYQVGIGRPATLIFSRDQGAAWDLYTLAVTGIFGLGRTADVPGSAGRRPPGRPASRVPTRSALYAVADRFPPRHDRGAIK